MSRRAITDTTMLNFLEHRKREHCPQNWVGVLYDGTTVLDEPTGMADRFDLDSSPRPTFRQSIRAAIKAERRKTKEGR